MGMISNSPITDRFSTPLPGFAARSDHARASNAREARLWNSLPERRNQLSTEVIAGCLAGNQNNQWCGVRVSHLGGAT